jgi:hypothetical protein
MPCIASPSDARPGERPFRTARPALGSLTRRLDLFATWRLNFLSARRLDLLAPRRLDLLRSLGASGGGEHETGGGECEHHAAFHRVLLSRHYVIDTVFGFDTRRCQSSDRARRQPAEIADGGSATAACARSMAEPLVHAETAVGPAARAWSAFRIETTS